MSDLTGSRYMMAVIDGSITRKLTLYCVLRNHDLCDGNGKFEYYTGDKHITLDRNCDCSCHIKYMI